MNLKDTKHPVIFSLLCLIALWLMISGTFLFVLTAVWIPWHFLTSFLR